MNNFIDHKIIELGHWVVGFFDEYPLLKLVVQILLYTLPLMLSFMGAFAFSTWLERKGLARIQNRPGPNRVGIFGLLQPMADGIKMLLKEDIVPEESDKLFHLLAPVMLMVPAMIAIGFLPVGDGLNALPLDSAILFFFAIGSMNTIAVFMAGWSSRNKYSLLGGMRAVAQMISYEIPLVLSAVTVIMIAGSLNGQVIVASQQISGWVGSGDVVKEFFGQILGWHIFKPWGFAGFIFFFVAALAEANRSPFDLPEADSEIIAGHLTEYSGFKYAIFFIAEYISAFAIAGIAVTLFLGGWSGPILSGLPWFVIKLFSLFAVMIWIRGTLPRLRVDQLMGYAWKFLMPLAILNIFVAGFYYFAEQQWGTWVALIGGWIFGFGALQLAAKGLSRLNKSPLLKGKRVYQYAE
ncbi:MAG: NADH-quinone oxidoreductase subunit NuoH [Opitutales bacterium]|jgi:NADH-quinone oxidoreductase subunit H|nr:NADH-quinone oxidoreductase subunit NuoH [bacterium]MDG2169478.1 NADH-quinone oxidoreductase subunit NuoH [Opitutales bacterium]